MNINESPDPRSSMWAWIAYSLRFHRMQRGLTGDSVGKLLNCARSSISRLENGEAKLDEKQAAILDGAWHTGSHFSIMVWYARQGHDPTWFKNFTEFEARAERVHSYDGQLIPALFQTPGYARALLEAGRNQDVEEDLKKRLARQKVLDSNNPPELWVLLSESAIDIPVGGADVMREQLAYLLELSRRPNVFLRIVPKSAGAHEGLDGPFKIITVKQGEVGFVEAPNGGRLVLEAAEVRGLKLRFDRIGAVALPVESSRRLIEQLMESFT
ncbi:helix-turn-helix domain-containing protein [Spirillospora sp. NPDC048824]|uniref:helix-turn-helix domain-containing protein n=1 Tax=Spirillospora sp. NPDC048824 TaxID=3364526 RepID=UPI00371ADF99